MLQLKVQLPSGEVNIPVDPQSTPGHLKENLKYSIRVPPKFIKLSCNGRELDDIHHMAGEPNNVRDGDTLVCEAKEGAQVEAEEAARKDDASKVAKQPTMIKKDEPPKPKKPKKDVVRPTLAPEDVQKQQTLAPGYKAWSAQYLEGRNEKRQMALVRLTAMEDGGKVYPEQEDAALPMLMGDPHCSPVWTEACTQLEIGEKAVFKVNRKAVDFDPEGLNPTESCAQWTVELLGVLEVYDLNGDYSAVLHIEDLGGEARAQELDRVAVHWRSRRWMAEGTFVNASSRERIAIMPGYGLVPIEDMHAPPVSINVGEGQQEALELIAGRVGPGGKGHLYLKTEAMKDNRPGGCVIMDVELVGIDSCSGPGSPGWQGWTSLVHERETGDQWLEEADERRKQLETFGTLRKSTDSSKDAEQHVSDQVHKFAGNAARRYRRAAGWLDRDEKPDDRKIVLEKATVSMRLAKAITLAQQRFGAAAEGDAPEEEKKAIQEARALLKKVLATAEDFKNEQLTFECLKMDLQIAIQASDAPEARAVLERLQALRPSDDELKNDSARLNRMEAALNLKKGAGTIETLQKDLQAGVAAQDKEKCREALGPILELIKSGQVTWDTVRTLKVGKDVGNAMKLGDPDLAAAARKVVSEIQVLAQKAGIGL